MNLTLLTVQYVQSTVVYYTKRICDPHKTCQQQQDDRATL